MKLFGRQKQADTIASYQRLFESEDGKKVIKDLARVARIDAPTFAPDNQYETAFREGERSIVLRIIKMINTDPAYVLELLAGQSER